MCHARYKSSHLCVCATLSIRKNNRFLHCRNSLQQPCVPCHKHRSKFLHSICLHNKPSLLRARLQRLIVDHYQRTWNDHAVRHRSFIFCYQLALNFSLNIAWRNLFVFSGNEYVRVASMSLRCFCRTKLRLPWSVSERNKQFLTQLRRGNMVSIMIMRTSSSPMHNRMSLSVQVFAFAYV